LAPGLPRTPFNSPPLVRLLASLAPAAPPAAPLPEADLGERLGRWLDWTDAIALAQALNRTGDSRPGAGRSGDGRPGTSQPPAVHGAAAQAAAALARVRDDLARAITSDPVFQPGQRDEADLARDLAAYRLAAQAQQRAMAAAIAPLRARLRCCGSWAPMRPRRLASCARCASSALPGPGCGWSSSWPARWRASPTTPDR